MNTPIIPRSAPQCKSATDLFSPTDLICPQTACRSGCYFSTQAARVWCPTCGWALTLTLEQTTEITEALLGISDLPIGQYLLILNAQCEPPTAWSLPADDSTGPAYRVEGGAA